MAGGSVCGQGVPCGCVSGAAAAVAAVLLKSGAGGGRFPPAHLGQSVCRQQSVVPHLPRTGAPAMKSQPSPFSSSLPPLSGCLLLGEADGLGEPPAPASAHAGGACLNVGAQEAGYGLWETREGGTRGCRAITQNPKGIWAQDWGRPGSRSSPASALAPGAPASGANPNFKPQPFECGGEGRLRGSGHLPRTPLCGLFSRKHGAAFLGSGFFKWVWKGI